MSILDGNSQYFQRFLKDMQTSWIYRCLARVTPRQAGWVFCGSALMTSILFFLSINERNTQYTYTYLFMVMLSLTILAGIFGLSTWSINKYITNEETRIAARGGLYSGVILYLFLMILTISPSLH